VFQHLISQERTLTQQREVKRKKSIEKGGGKRLKNKKFQHKGKGNIWAPASHRDGRPDQKVGGQVEGD